MATPQDVVKSAIQGDDPDKPKYKGTVDCVLKTYKQEGLSYFMKGWTVQMTRAVPVNMLTFVIYEHILFFCKGTLVF